VLVAAASLYWVRSFNEAAPVLPQPEDGFAPGASVRS
jgi:hypothetical protein